MAKKQLKKLNQPKKYLQGGSNMASVAQTRQNPYYIGQVNADAAEEKFQSSQDQLAQARLDAAQAQKEAREAENQQLDATVRAGAADLVKATATDQKAGRLGKLFSRGPLSGQAALNLSAGTQVAPMYAAPATTTVASNVGALTPGAVEVGANLANTSTNVVSGVNAATAGVPTIAAPTGEFVTQGVAAGAKGAAGMSALTSGLIGVAGNIAGTVIKNKTNDNSAYTATKNEATGNVVGSGVKSAATGFVLGNMILPGVGGAIGAGIGAGIGALKARKENKAAKEEADRLQAEQAAIRGAFQSAYVDSHSTGPDTGFGLNSSTNMNNQFTSAYQVARDGGVRKYVAGGEVGPCPPGLIPSPGGGCIKDLSAPPTANSSLFNYYNDAVSKYGEDVAQKMLKNKRTCNPGEECWEEAEIEQPNRRQFDLKSTGDASIDRLNASMFGPQGANTDNGYIPLNDPKYNPYRRTGGATSIQTDRRTKYIPGGKIVPIEGTDAVEYVGRSHEEGGMFPEAKKQGGKIKDKGSIEVEGGETEDQVIMEDNNTRDYIFSKYLKLGGKSFAQRHKEILKGTGSQAEIQQLAAMQEKMAGRNPQQIARYRGIHKYVDGGVTEPCQNGYVKDANGNCVPEQPYQQEGVFNRENPGAPTKEDLATAVFERRPGPSGSIISGYRLKDGTFYDPNNMTQKIQSVQKEGAEIEAGLFSLPGAALSGVRSGLAGATRLGYNMINDKALPSGSSGSAGALPAGNTSAVGNYGGNVFAAKPQAESFNVFGNYPAMIKQAGQLAASGAQPQGSSSAAYTGPTGKGEGQQYFNNVGQGQGQSDPYNTAANAEKMGWGKDVEGYIRSEFGFGPNYKAPAAPSKGGTKKGKPAYDREAWRDKGVALMTDEELAAVGPQDSIPEGAQYRRPPGATSPPVASGQGTAPANITGTFRDNGDGTFSYGSDEAGWETSMDKNVAKSKFQTKQVNAAGTQTAPQGSAPYMAPAGVAGSAPSAQAGPVTTAGQTIVAGNTPSNAPAGTQSAVSSQTVTGTGTTATNTGANNNQPSGTTNTGTNTNAPTINNQNTKFQYTAKNAGYLDYSDPNVAGGIWSGKRYDTEWRPLVASTMADPKMADQVISYLTNYTGQDAADVKAKIKGKSREQQIAIINDLATDTKVGPFHNAVLQGIQSTTPPEDTKPSGGTPPPTEEKPSEETPTETTKKREPCPPGTYLSTDGTCQPVPAFKQGRGIDGSMLAGLGQLVPVGAALLNPYKIAPGIMGAPAIKGALMPRMNMNQERASAIQQNVAFKNAVLGQNSGPAALIAMQNANSKTGQQMLGIAKQEQDANKQLAAQEGSLAMEASKFNADTGQKTQMFNKEFNKDERRYRREDILGALDSAASRIAGIFKDKKSYEAQERLARALDETKSYDRFSIYEQLAKQANQKNSPYYGVPDAELRRMAAGISEQIYGDMGIVAEAPGTAPARTGGVRQYISRLGDLKSARATKAKL
jgi:hypothetical protein